MGRYELHLSHHDVLDNNVVLAVGRTQIKGTKSEKLWVSLQKSYFLVYALKKKKNRHVTVIYFTYCRHLVPTEAFH